VSTANLSPVTAKFGSILVGDLSLCDEGHPLSEVEVNVLLIVTTFDLDEGCVVILVTKTTLVTEDGPGYV